MKAIKENMNIMKETNDPERNKKLQESWTEVKNALKKDPATSQFPSASEDEIIDAWMAAVDQAKLEGKKPC